MEVIITKKADDPVCLRISIGGGEKVGGYYLSYRGTKEDAIAGLETALASMRALAKNLGPGREPDIAPNGGKLYS